MVLVWVRLSLAADKEKVRAQPLIRTPRGPLEGRRGAGGDSPQSFLGVQARGRTLSRSGQNWG